MFEQGESIDFSAVDSRLNEDDRTLLHQLAFADEGHEEAVPVGQAMECVRRLLSEEHKAGREEVRAQIKAAERAGNMTEALRLMEELGKSERGA